jgi:hypothetical protein
MDNAIKELFKHIGDDYARSRSGSEYFDPKSVGEFIDNLRVEEGRKYLKITKKLGNQTMVWGFIVKKDDKKFRAGDILKAAGWSAPARNKPRGNIIQGDFSWVRWTGPEYL